MKLEMRVGSLVEVGPLFGGLYLVVHAGSEDPFLDDVPILYNLKDGTMAPMERQFIKVLSE